MVFPPGYTRLFVATIIGETPLSQLITTCHRFGHKLQAVVVNEINKPNAIEVVQRQRFWDTLRCFDKGGILVHRSDRRERR